MTAHGARCPLRQPLPRPIQLVGRHLRAPLRRMSTRRQPMWPSQRSCSGKLVAILWRSRLAWIKKGQTGLGQTCSSILAQKLKNSKMQNVTFLFILCIEKGELILFAAKAYYMYFHKWELSAHKERQRTSSHCHKKPIFFMTFVVWIWRRYLLLFSFNQK